MPQQKQAHLRPPPEPEDGFGRLLSEFYTMRRSLGGTRGSAWQPKTDVYETDEQIVIKADLAGLDADQVAVKVNGEVITICGYRRGPDPNSVVAYHQMEIHNGYFERRIAIHKAFDPDKATARYENGFLYVNVPKAPRMVRHVLTLRISV